MKTDHLLFGAAYYSEYLPYDRVEKDMEMMEKAGMNTIRIAESTWSTIEPKDGIFDFTHLDKMLEAAARHHISVIVGTPTYAIPAWLSKKYPDILALTNNGQNIYGARQNMDITHAGYLFHCERVIRAMMEHIKDVPHIIGFQLDNETKSYGTAGLRVQAMFVDYLKEKYPDINEFNREFGLDYWSNRINTWEDFPDVRGTINESLAAEFAKFQRLLVTRFLAWLPYPGQLRLQAYSHIANGSNSVMYWHWHSIHNAIESYWKGVLSHDFSENETYLEASTIGADWKQIGAHLKNLQKKNRVAILLDNNSLTGLRLFPLKDLGNYSYNTVARWLGDALYHLNIEYDMISSAERDFSSYGCLIVPALYSASEDLLTAISDYVKNGGHLITTFRSGFSDEQLKIYADTQPHILQECLGIHYDQYTYPVDVSVTLPDFMAHPSCSGHENAASDAGSSCSDESCTNSSKCLHWMDLVTCDTATPLFFYDHPVWKKYAAATVNQFGKGSAMYLASMFDGVLLEKVLVSYFASLPEVILSHPECHFPFIIKEGINDFGKRVRFYFNYSGETQTTACADMSGTELLSGNTISKNTALTLDPWGVFIIEENE